MGRGLGSFVGHVAGNVLAETGAAMRESRLAALKQGAVDKQNEFTAGQNQLGRDSVAASAAAGNESRMGLLREKGLQEQEMQLAGFQQQFDLLKLKHTQALEAGNEKQANALELKRVDIEGKMQHITKQIGSTEKIAGQKDETARAAIAAGTSKADKDRSSKEDMSAAQIASAEKMLGLKIESSEAIAAESSASKLEVMAESNTAAMARVKVKIAEAKRSQNSKQETEMERLKSKLESDKTLLDRKLEVTQSEGDKGRESKKAMAREKNVAGITSAALKPDVSGKTPDSKKVSQAVTDARNALDGTAPALPKPSAAAIAFLKNDPANKAAFIQKYGQKAYDSAVGK